MQSIVVLVDVVGACLRKVDILHHRHEQQRHQVQRVQAGYAQHQESVAVDAAFGDARAVFPEKDETADAPEDLHTVEAVDIEQLQQRIERLRGRYEVDGSCAPE